MVERVVRRQVQAAPKPTPRPKGNRRRWRDDDLIEIVGVMPKSPKQQRQELIDELRPLAPKRSGDFLLKRIAMWPEGREKSNTDGDVDAGDGGQDARGVRGGYGNGDAVRLERSGANG